ncbi:MAG: hypothetical protein PHH28_10385 [Desulfuromonadaceae bacterium]|nr:hypothetical protein [Desulfuromonadaceae bacterium]
MRILKLAAPVFLDPRWFNRDKSADAPYIVGATGLEINVGGEMLYLTEALPPGTVDHVWLDRFFYCCRQDEYEIEEAARLERVTQQKIAQEQATNDRLREARAEAEQFNASLKIPVPWCAGIKDVLSGLNENNNGDGRNRATVEHILLLEDLHEGKLHRPAGAFLCSINTGKQWSTQTRDDWFDEKENPYIPRITCKACLKIAQRWNG